MAWIVPAIQLSPPAGDVNVTLGGGMMLNIPLLASFVAALEASLMRTNPWRVSEAGTVQE
jgi:hypothetical protein